MYGAKLWQKTARNALNVQNLWNGQILPFFASSFFNSIILYDDFWLFFSFSFFWYSANTYRMIIVVWFSLASCSLPKVHLFREDNFYLLLCFRLLFGTPKFSRILEPARNLYGLFRSRVVFRAVVSHLYHTHSQFTMSGFVCVCVCAYGRGAMVMMLASSVSANEAQFRIQIINVFLSVGRVVQLNPCAWFTMRHTRNGLLWDALTTYRGGEREISGVLLLSALFFFVALAQTTMIFGWQWLLMLLWFGWFNRNIKCQTFAQNTDSFIRFFFYFSDEILISIYLLVQNFWRILNQETDLLCFAAIVRVFFLLNSLVIRL